MDEGISTSLKIISGGQTGADRAALDFAIEHGIPHGGWCPQSRRAEDGPIDNHYQLKETPNGDYVERTEWNVRDSDGTGQTIGQLHVHVIPRYHGDVPDPRGGVRFVIPAKARYWEWPTV